MINQEMIVCYTRENGKTISAKIIGELVRCKDCRWRDDQSGSTAWMPCRALITPNDFYCPRGERKDGERE